MSPRQAAAKVGLEPAAVPFTSGLAALRRMWPECRKQTVEEWLRQALPNGAVQFKGVGWEFSPSGQAFAYAWYTFTASIGFSGRGNSRAAAESSTDTAGF